MTDRCTGCGAAVDLSDGACRLCGIPAVAMDKGAGASAGDGKVIEPEVLVSIEEAERSSGSGSGGPRSPFDSRGPFGPQGTVRPLGCTVGQGCGCIGLPLALLAGAVVSAFMALLWLLSLGRVPVSVVRMVQRLRQRPPRG